jgi:hypothetical protein
MPEVKTTGRQSAFRRIKAARHLSRAHILGVTRIEIKAALTGAGLTGAALQADTTA